MLQIQKKKKEEKLNDVTESASSSNSGNSSTQFEDNRPASLMQLKLKNEFESASGRKKDLPNETVQRKIIGGNIKIAMGRTLGGVLKGLNDIDLVEGDHGINLEIKFDELGGGTMGLTTIWVKGEKINPHTEITPEEAKKNTYTILIQLNEKEFKGGKYPSLFGNLFETISHEWELHGRQHALNITAARKGKDTLHRIDHVAHFSKKPTGLDAVIAQKILAEEKQPRIQQQIFDSYMQDVFAHIGHLQADHLFPNEETKTILPVEMLFKYLRTVVDSISVYKKVLKPSNPFDKNLLMIDKYAKSHTKDLTPPKEYLGPDKLSIYRRTGMWIKLLNSVFSERPPKDSVMETALFLIRKDVKDALYYLHKLQDLWSVPKAAKINVHGEDDMEEWKRAVLIPRMKALASYGVDVETLNSKLSLTEKGSPKQGHHGPVKPRVIRLDPSTMEPLETPILKNPINRGKKKESSSQLHEPSKKELMEQDPLMDLFDQGKLGLYHIGSIRQDFPPEIVKLILAGNKGPFENKIGQEITFVKRKSEDTFYFDAPFLH